MNRFRFALRDLFWLVLMAGIGCMWWLDRGQLLRSEEQLQTEKRELQRQLRIATFNPAVW